MPDQQSDDHSVPWSIPVLMTMRRSVLAALSRHGAMSITEFDALGLEVLRTPMDREMLIVLVESARRFGLVAPLQHERRADGSPIVDVEWALTAAGAHDLTGLGARVAQAAKPLNLLVSTLSTLGLLAAIKGSLDTVDIIVAPHVAAGIGLLVPIVILAVAIALSARRGASDQAVAEALGLEHTHPEAYALVITRGDRRTAVLTYLVIITAIVFWGNINLAASMLAIGVISATANLWDVRRKRKALAASAVRAKDGSA